MSLSFKEVAEIMKIIDSSSCEELVLEAEGMRLVVRRGGNGSASAAAATVANAPVAPAAATPGTAAHRPATTAQPASVPVADGMHTEKAPMVGTFYRRPSPDEAAFVDVGSTVSPGDPLCMIEVMKLYTTISASTGGVVEAILADDSALVEFDQPLFLIRPA